MFYSTTILPSDLCVSRFISNFGPRFMYSYITDHYMNSCIHIILVLDFDSMFQNSCLLFLILCSKMYVLYFGEFFVRGHRNLRGLTYLNLIGNFSAKLWIYNRRMRIRNKISVYDYVSHFDICVVECDIELHYVNMLTSYYDDDV